jgi:hypothetical protein
LPLAAVGFSIQGSIESLLGSEGASIVYADLDSDGDLEFASWNEASEWADFDEDGHLDVIDFLVDSRPVWYKNERGVLSDEQPLNVPGRIANIQIADIDGDGDLDVLAVLFPFNYGSKVFWLENSDHRGTFVMRETDIYNSHVLAPADFDGDGDLDLLIGKNLSYVASELLWVENRNHGFLSADAHTIDATIFHGVLASKNSAAAGDIDGDGDLDLAAIKVNCSPACSDPFSILLFENTDGRGTFTQKLRIDTPDNGVGQLQLVDVEGDGDLDVVAMGIHPPNPPANDYRGKLVWFENLTGGWNYNSQQLITTVRRSNSSNSGYELDWIVRDFDLDGDADFLVPDENTNYMVVKTRLVGDVNDDHVFDSRDLIAIFQAGEYEDGVTRNSSFDDGDWNGDGEFDSGDLVIAFQNGSYVSEAMKGISGHINRRALAPVALAKTGKTGG